MATFASNSIAKTSGYIAKEAALGFYNNTLLLPAVDRQYSNEFGTVAGGAKVGSTIRVRCPAQFTTTNSVALDSSTVQAVVEQTKVLTLADRTGIHFELSTEQVTLDIESEGSMYSERILQPAGKALGAAVEAKGFEAAAKFANNAIIVAGGYSATNMKKYFLDAKALLQKQLAPVGDRWAFVDSNLEVSVVDQSLVLFHANEEIEKAYKEGTMGQFGGLKWGASDLIYIRTNGAGGLTVTVGAAYTEGSETMTIAGAGAASIAVGDKIQFAGISLINAQSKQVYYGTPVTRAVKAVNGSVITIDPIFASGSQANASALPANGSTITVLGVSGKHYACQIVAQKSGITFANADLYLPNNVDMAAREKVMDVSLRYIRDYRIGSDDLPSRLEILHTWALLRPEWVASIEIQLD